MVNGEREAPAPPDLSLSPPGLCGNQTRFSPFTIHRSPFTLRPRAFLLRLRPPPPRLPALPLRPVRVALRQLDPDGGAGMARAPSDRFGVRGGAGDDARVAADSAVHPVRRSGGGPGRQAKAGAGAPVRLGR